jgi:hypothetical protein
MHPDRILRGLALAAGIVAFAAPAMADIGAFRAAMEVQDYKLATTEARATWPTLDKSRADLPSIAREFGLAAYRASDFVASEFFADRALSAGAAESEALRLESEMLLQMSRLKMNPRPSTRDKVVAALERRSALPDVGLLSYYAADGVMSYAFSQANWRDVEAGAVRSRQIAAQVIDVPAGEHHRITLRQEIGRFFEKREQRSYDSLDDLRWRVIAEISAAPDDVAARSLVDVYWDISAWQEAIAATLYSLYRFNTADAEARARTRILRLTKDDRAVRLLDFKPADAACDLRLTMSKRLQYPTTTGLNVTAGAVYLQVDIDEKGMASNGRILAAVPLKSFGDAVLLGVRDMRYAPGENWGPDCVVARKGRVASFSFAVR